MPQSLSLNIIHLVFSTKHRENRLYRDLRPDLFAMMATVVNNTKSHAYRVGGVDNHVHLAIRLHPTLAGAQLVNILKTQSSQWIKNQPGPAHPRGDRPGFAVRSVSWSHFCGNAFRHHGQNAPNARFFLGRDSVVSESNPSKSDRYVIFRSSEDEIFGVPRIGKAIADFGMGRR